MGHDVIPIGQHKLTTSTIETMAKELSVIYNATIHYGYKDMCLECDGPERTYDLIELGKIVVTDSERIFALEDQYYLDRINNPEKYSTEIEFEFYDLKNYDRYNYQIYKESFNAQPYFDSRWSSFCSWFTGEITNADFLNGLNEYRMEVYREVKKLGGGFAVYGDDQGESAWLLNGDLSWDDTVAKLQNDFGDDFVNISSFFMQQLPLRKKFPLAFFDDFADLKR